MMLPGLQELVELYTLTVKSHFAHMITQGFELTLMHAELCREQISLVIIHIFNTFTITLMHTELSAAQCHLRDFNGTYLDAGGGT